MRVEAADVLADWPPEEAASVGMLDLPIAPGRVWLPRALATALEDGPVPALVSVAGEGVFDVVVLTGDLHAFERDPGRGLPDELRGGVWAAEAIDRGPLKVPVKRVVVDPTRSLACQDWLRSETLAYAPLDGDEVAGAVRFAEAVLASEEADDYRRELEARAVRVAENHYWQDPVTGTSNWPYIGDISDQLARGVPPEEVEVLPTTSVFLDPGDLEWLKPGGELLLFADTVTGRGLGWIDFWAHLSVDVEAPAGWLEVMLPPEGDLGLYLRPFEAERNTCAEDLPAPLPGDLPGRPHRSALGAGHGRGPRRRVGGVRGQERGPRDPPKPHRDSNQRPGAGIRSSPTPRRR